MANVTAAGMLVENNTLDQRGPSHAPTTAPQRELTLRALATGLLLGALLAPCNVYSGLKIGWSFNMSIASLLLAFALWRGLERLGASRWQPLESNINQTAASSAASIISGGLVAPIPALALLDGRSLDWLPLSAWVFSVSFLGVWVAWYLRPSLIERQGLTFPDGVATAETLKEIFGHGQEAMLRVRMLLGAGLFAAGVRAVDALWWAIPRWAPSPTAGKLGFNLDPSLLMLGFGAIIGPRAGLSLLLGAIIAWGGLGPWAIAQGWIAVDTGAVSWFAPLVEWLIWPGVSLMVAHTLTGLVLQMQRSRRARSWRPSGLQRGPLVGFATASVLTILLQTALFDIALGMALIAIPLAFVLASVAARVTGETGIAPIGAIGKVSQLSFGVLAPGQAVTNLMTANVAGGAAGQCADLLNDLKVGHLIGARPQRQAIAQCCGILAGSLVGSAVYLLLIPDPQTQLLTPEWPAPAVATWKAVAETLSLGLGSIPLSARWGMLVGVLCGIALSLLDSRCHRLPSGTAMGLAFVIPASTSITLCAGALLATALNRSLPDLSRRFVLAAAAGLVAGESLFGVGATLLRVIRP